MGEMSFNTPLSQVSIEVRPGEWSQEAKTWQTVNATSSGERL